MFALIKRQRVGPHLGAIGIEHQRRIFRRGDPSPAGELVVELLRPPAGIAECDQALLWPMAGADVAQYFGGIAQGHAAVDVTRVRPMILGAVQRKSDVRADWSAEKYQHAIAHARAISAERGKDSSDRTPRHRPVDDDAERAVAIMLRDHDHGMIERVA